MLWHVKWPKWAKTREILIFEGRSIFGGAESLVWGGLAPIAPPWWRHWLCSSMLPRFAAALHVMVPHHRAISQNHSSHNGFGIFKIIGWHAMLGYPVIPQEPPRSINGICVHVLGVCRGYITTDGDFNNPAQNTSIAQHCTPKSRLQDTSIRLVLWNCLPPHQDCFPRLQEWWTGAQKCFSG